MPLVKQRLSFPFSGGQEQSMAKELVDPPALLVAHNVVYTRAGELTKRTGWKMRNESGSPALTQPDRIAARGDEILWIGQNRSNTCVEDSVDVGEIYRTTVGRFKTQPRLLSRVIAESRELTPNDPVWRDHGYVARWNVDKLCEILSVDSGLIGSATGVSGEGIPLYWDCAFAGDQASPGLGESGVLGIVYVSGAPLTERTVQFVAIDVATKAVIASQVVASYPVSGTVTIKIPRIIATKHNLNRWYFQVFFIEQDVGVSYTLRKYHIPVHSPWTTAVSQAVISGFNAQYFDVCCTGPAGLGGVGWTFEKRVFLVWCDNSSNRVRARLFTTATADGTITAQVSTFQDITWADPATVIYEIACACDPDGRYLCAFVASNNGVGATRATAMLWTMSMAPAYAFGAFSSVSTGVMPRDVQAMLGIAWRGVANVSGTDYYAQFGITWWTLDGSYLYRMAWSSIGDRGAGLGFIGSSTNPTTPAYRNWSRPWYFRGAPHQWTIRGHAPDAIVSEAISWGPPSTSGGGDPPPQPYPVILGRANAGELVASLRGYFDGSICRGAGRFSCVESWYERGRFFCVMPTVSVDSTFWKFSIMDVSAVETSRLTPAELGGCTYFATSIPWVYDGRHAHEVGFCHRPQSVTSANGEINLTAVAGAGPAAGDYYVAMCWESIDSFGRVARSAPSIAGPVTIAAGQTIRVDLQTLGVSSHPHCSPVAYVSNDGGLTYVRSDEVFGNTYSPVPSSAAPDISLTLSGTYMFRTGRPTLYTSQGILENSPPPQARHMCEWQNRIWIANGRTVSYSREVIDGEEAAFNEALSFQMPKTVTGIMGLDDRLIVFAKDAVYQIYGDGPTDTGEGAFSQPIRIPSDFGCIDSRSIVRTDKGLCYQSSRGIELLDRALSPRMISGGVDYLIRDSGYREIISASWDSEAQICRFIARVPSNETQNIVLCWHTMYELWTTASVPQIGNYYSGRTPVPIGIVSALGRNWIGAGDINQYSGTPVCAIASECRSYDSDVTYMDGTPGLLTAVWYQCIVETANIKTDGLLGFARIWRVEAEIRDTDVNTGLQIAYAIDYNANTSGTRTWSTAAEIASGTDIESSRKRFGIHIDKQQCTAIRVRVSDVRADDSLLETRLTLIGLRVDWAQKPGTKHRSERSRK